jgi:hypothetical protein
MDSMQQEGLVVAGLLASHSPTKATPVPAPPIRLTLQHWGLNIGQHSDVEYSTRLCKTKRLMASDVVYPKVEGK